MKMLRISSLCHLRSSVPRFMSSGAAQMNVSAKTRALLDRLLRVSHAGELGATRICQGQIAVLGKSNVGPLLKEMLKQEEEHLTQMKELVPSNRVRPSALLPVWSIAGYVLGAGTALLGKESAMACTVAIETVIGEHYDNQIRDLIADGLEKHKPLIELLRRLRDDELEHLHTGIQHNAEQAPFYSAMTEVIKVGCRGAIWVAEKI